MVLGCMGCMWCYGVGVGVLCCVVLCCVGVVLCWCGVVLCCVVLCLCCVVLCCVGVGVLGR